ncbi:M48 family metallopeptidase [Chamaesiphon minutus]|uniref:Zn-dependent protease with chaperone function n=1 Tax=Chamaesiphon minutus (strain ATCC 27169 / PCC 6605) TaxID=1173020 RepID=K9UFJ8_CHAP6|nr:M48 family metallopeptidase [Chamaesiphon minutus]AFY93423.1 Zn-dependent protease with chaperone function [Chamaesiphon minutus PCC 6605]
MSFFEQQDRSRRATRTLVGIFVAAVMFTGICIYFAAMLSINTTSLKWAVFGDRLSCQPIVPTSLTTSPRAISAQVTIPFLPPAPDSLAQRLRQRDYQVGRFSGFSRAGNAARRSFSGTSRPNYSSNRNIYYNSTTRSGSPMPNCRQPAIWWDGRVLCWTLLGTAMLMGIPAWWKIQQLRAGGAVIAAELGGRRICAEQATPAERQLLNIVEEMAIAATIAVPPVYLLDNEAGINAFAAGFTVNDAVIGVTQGSLEQLTRDELQGVIAHEFSHILNGDMAMNIRLMGVLHGILCLHLTGRLLSYTTWSRDNPLWIFGLLLRAIGFSGFISGRLIQSAISRQRELLADASAVQFTRNADGIGSALAKVGGMGSQIDSPYAETTSHMFFSSALNFSWLEGLFATHPPLALRLQIIHGTGQRLGNRIVINGQTVPTFNPIVSTPAVAGFASTGAENLYEYESQTTAESAPVGEYGTLAYIYALLLDSQRSIEQLAYLAQLEEPAVIEQIENLRETVANIPQHQRLSTLDRQVTKLRDTPHVPRLLKCAYGMVNILPAENWHTAIVYLILAHRLAPTTGLHPELYHSIEDVWAEIVNILGTLARLSSDRPQDIDYRFEASLLRLPSSHHTKVELPPELTWREFQTDLSKIATATTKVKQTLIAACLEILTNQRQILPTANDLTRSIAILLDCPIPPLLDRAAVRIGG